MPHSPDLIDSILKEAGFFDDMKSKLTGFLQSREKKRATSRVGAHFDSKDKDWDRVVANSSRKSFVKELAGDARADDKLKMHVDSMNRLKTGKVLSTVSGTEGSRTARRDGSQSYKIVKLRGSNRLGCTCRDWRFKKSVAAQGEQADCKHIREFKQVNKTAGHVEDRIAERAPGSTYEVAKIKAQIPSMKLRKGQTYHVPLKRGKGYAVIGDIGPKHVVKTVLGPNMRPPGHRAKAQFGRLAGQKLARAPRDYKQEYAEYHGKPDQVSNRSLRNQARRKMGLKKGDPREVDHKTPISKGGGNGKGNLSAVSREFNRRKFNGS